MHVAELDELSMAVKEQNGLGDVMTVMPEAPMLAVMPPIGCQAVEALTEFLVVNFVQSVVAAHVFHFFVPAKGHSAVVTVRRVRTIRMLPFDAAMVVIVTVFGADSCG